MTHRSISTFFQMGGRDVTPSRHNGRVIETDQFRRLTDLAQRFANDGIDGLDDESIAAVALLSRRLGELADRLEVHALGALEEAGYAERECNETTANWFSINAHVSPATGSRQVKLARLVR